VDCCQCNRKSAACDGEAGDDFAMVRRLRAPLMAPDSINSIMLSVTISV